ncbi:hypothetical protein [Gudongella sp. DL1XJH-153]|uniref:hypothetical protein n=1 Tax=Gudongella sp. DL1XJH-153 TaxID=3409804 RepID=UPI003BB6602E
MIYNNNKNIKTLTMSAFALALSVFSLLLFRGPISIASTFLIPVIIVLFSRGQLKSYLLVYAGLFTTTLLFFPTQIIFVATYMLLSALLKVFFITSTFKVNISLLGVIGYILIVSLVLFVGIRLTELVFLVPLHTMMLRISGNNFLSYSLILVIEGIFVSIFNIGILRLFVPRIATS